MSSGATAGPVPRRVLDAADPVAAFLEAHQQGQLIALPTSGTTGRPRHVLRTTASWVESFPTVTALTGWDHAARVWIPGPLSATMNLYAAVHTRMVGARPVDDLTEASHVQLTPAVLRRLLNDGAGVRGRTLVVAGDALDVGLRTRAEAAGAVVAHYYGAAQLSFVAWGNDAETLRPFPGVEIELRPPDVDDSPSSAVIWARSPYLAEGTEGGFDPLQRDGSGFATVGDRGRWDGDRLLVLGRDDTVVTGGVTVLLAEVEAALRPGLRGQVAAIGLPHPVLGAVVGVVLTDAADDAPARVRARTLGSRRPVRWSVRPEFPLTPAGKIDRSALARDVAKQDAR